MIYKFYIFGSYCWNILVPIVYLGEAQEIAYCAFADWNFWEVLIDQPFWKINKVSKEIYQTTLTIPIEQELNVLYMFFLCSVKLCFSNFRHELLHVRKNLLIF